MNETAHTSGPLTLRRNGAEIWKGDHIVALAVGGEFEADAMIRAANAAPDLLEACHKAMTCQANMNSDVVAIIGNAVARATQ